MNENNMSPVQRLCYRYGIKPTESRFDVMLPKVMELAWIPCDDRLPDVGRDRILICLSESATQKTWFSDIGRVFEGGYSGNGFHIQRRICESGDVIAWMPLPKPYKGGEQYEK